MIGDFGLEGMVLKYFIINFPYLALRTSFFYNVDYSGRVGCVRRFIISHLNLGCFFIDKNTNSDKKINPNFIRQWFPTVFLYFSYHVKSVIDVVDALGAICNIPKKFVGAQ
ncbi:hypothetical protein HHI36_019007 [Cryptolaemus montrouzieri]|uniref:Uncharacterized protein n=1 Tax=Cryptolaemus montrouzieri TaxID=559131 RepID=A0ABD2P2Q3_9CUCU